MRQPDLLWSFPQESVAIQKYDGFKDPVVVGERSSSELTLKSLIRSEIQRYANNHAKESPAYIFALITAARLHTWGGLSPRMLQGFGTLCQSFCLHPQNPRLSAI